LKLGLLRASAFEPDPVGIVPTMLAERAVRPPGNIDGRSAIVLLLRQITKRAPWLFDRFESSRIHQVYTLADLMGLSRIDPQRLTAGGHAFDAITLRCSKCNMSRREWDQSKGTAKCQGDAVGSEVKRREAKTQPRAKK